MSPGGEPPNLRSAEWPSAVVFANPVPLGEPFAVLRLMPSARLAPPPAQKIQRQPKRDTRCDQQRNGTDLPVRPTELPAGNAIHDDGDIGGDAERRHGAEKVPSFAHSSHP